MVYELMHKDIVVADLEIDDDGDLQKLLAVYEPGHFPFGTDAGWEEKNPSGLKRWWKNRRIPMSRDDLAKTLGIILPEDTSTSRLLLHCHGLSLSDCYWIREKGKGTSFSEINFFENNYSYDLGDVLVGRQEKKHPSFLSPDATSEGNLKKRWKIIQGDRILLKSGSKPFCYEVYNEVIASTVCAYLGIPHIDYFLVEDGGETYCGCRDFVSYSQDFVTAYMVYKGGGKMNHESDYQFLLRRYRELGIVDAKKAIDQMLLVDYLLGNEDRHLNNFGLLRDANTLEFVGVAPIFDTGSCLGYGLLDEELARSKARPWKPFASHQRPVQLDYLDRLPLQHPSSLVNVPTFVALSLYAFPGLPASRCRAIVGFVERRVEEVCKRFDIPLSMEDAALNKTQRAILHYVSNQGGVLSKAEELCSALEISRITALRHIDVLVGLGRLKRIGSKKTGYWRLVKDQEAFLGQKQEFME